jgi:hypothetical protein
MKLLLLLAAAAAQPEAKLTKLPYDGLWKLIWAPAFAFVGLTKVFPS